jgi:hypothetical protein
MIFVVTYDIVPLPTLFVVANCMLPLSQSGALPGMQRSHSGGHASNYNHGNFFPGGMPSVCSPANTECPYSKTFVAFVCVPNFKPNPSTKYLTNEYWPLAPNSLAQEVV